jgi:hypothetical protein
MPGARRRTCWEPIFSDEKPFLRGARSIPKFPQYGSSSLFQSLGTFARQMLGDLFMSWLDLSSDRALDRAEDAHASPF